MLSPSTLLQKAMQSSATDLAELCWDIPQTLPSNINLTVVFNCWRRTRHTILSLTLLFSPPSEKRLSFLSPSTVTHSAGELFSGDPKISHNKTKKKKTKLLPGLDLISHSIMLLGLFCMFCCTPASSFFSPTLFPFSKNRALKVRHLLWADISRCRPFWCSPTLQTLNRTDYTFRLNFHFLWRQPPLGQGKYFISVS